MNAQSQPLKKRRPGRPLKGDEPRLQRKLMITDSDMITLRRIGGGSASEGVRLLIEKHDRLSNEETPDASKS